MAAGTLPASGLEVWLREPTGEDELLLVRSTGAPSVAMLGLLERLATSQDGGPIDCHALPAVDLGAAAMLIRGQWLGSTIRTEALCPTPDCTEPIDIAFSVSEYLEHHLPRRYRGARECEPGWFALPGSEVLFRVPTVADALTALTDGPTAIVRRCVRPPDQPPGILRRIDRALEALAPRLDGELIGSCPACREAVRLRFEPVAYVLQELCEACAGLFAQVHELALAYHWSEQAILALDRRRRHGYVAMIRGELALA